MKDQSEARYGRTLGDVPTGSFDDSFGNRNLFDPIPARHLRPSPHRTFVMKKMRNPMPTMTAMTVPMILNVTAEE